MSGDCELLFDGDRGSPTIVLAHGAGAPMDSAFMQQMAEGLAAAGRRVVRFEFPYMRRRRRSGRRGGPDPAPVLERCWRDVLEEIGDPGQTFIGGKSMGGRIASMIADDVGVRGLICLGYPFHPPRRPERLRVAHLAGLRTPALIVQGTRDDLGSREEIAGYDLSPSIRVEYLEDGDHSFKPRVRSGRTLADHMARAIAAVAEFSSPRPIR